VTPSSVDAEGLPQTASKLSIAPGSARAWVLSCRPKTLSAAAAPVMVGLAASLHEGPLLPLPALVTLVGAWFLQIASNLANDVFDHEKGADTEERLGPTRAVQAGLLSPRQMKRGLLICLALALLSGVYLTSVAGPFIVAIGLVSMVCAVAYTGGPYPLGYHGLGDLFVMLFFGVVAVCGTTFVQVGQVTPLALLCALPVGAVTTNILVVNNLRDRYTDAKAGKRTLAVRFGRRGAEAEYVGMYLLAYGTPVGLWLGGLGHATILLPAITLPLALRNIRGVFRDEGRALNAHLESSAKLVFIFGATFALGLLLSARGI
jgi:1,4-dihydroxy-2-naphthoate octaprenyltransferase